MPATQEPQTDDRTTDESCELQNPLLNRNVESTELETPVELVIAESESVGKKMFVWSDCLVCVVAPAFCCMLCLSLFQLESKREEYGEVLERTLPASVQPYAQDMADALWEGDRAVQFGAIFTLLFGTAACVAAWRAPGSGATAGRKFLQAAWVCAVLVPCVALLAVHCGQLVDWPMLKKDLCESGLFEVHDNFAVVFGQVGASNVLFRFLWSDISVPARYCEAHQDDWQTDLLTQHIEPMTCATQMCSGVSILSRALPIENVTAYDTDLDSDLEGAFCYEVMTEAGLAAADEDSTGRDLLQAYRGDDRAYLSSSNTYKDKLKQRRAGRRANPTAYQEHAVRDATRAYKKIQETRVAKLREYARGPALDITGYQDQQPLKDPSKGKGFIRQHGYNTGSNFHQARTKAYNDNRDKKANERASFLKETQKTGRRHLLQQYRGTPEAHMSTSSTYKDKIYQRRTGKVRNPTALQEHAVRDAVRAYKDRQDYRIERFRNYIKEPSLDAAGYRDSQPLWDPVKQGYVETQGFVRQHGYGTFSNFHDARTEEYNRNRDQKAADRRAYLKETQLTGKRLLAEEEELQEGCVEVPVDDICHGLSCVEPSTLTNFAAAVKAAVESTKRSAALVEGAERAVADAKCFYVAQFLIALGLGLVLGVAATSAEALIAPAYAVPVAVCLALPTYGAVLAMIAQAIGTVWLVGTNALLLVCLGAFVERLGQGEAM